MNNQFLCFDMNYYVNGAKYSANVTQEREPNNMARMTGKKHYTVSGGGGGTYETREDAEVAAKKQMESYARSGYSNSDVTIYEAVATVKFPLPSYEVVDIAKA